MGIDDADAVNMELQPGQFSVHHERMVHGSPPNGSALPRVGLSYTFIPCHVRSTIGRKGAVMMRGVDRFGNWDEDPLPRFNQDPVSGAVLKKFQQEYRDPNLLTEAERAVGTA